MRTCVFLCSFVCEYVLSNPRLQQIRRNVKVHELCINVTLIHVWVCVPQDAQPGKQACRQAPDLSILAQLALGIPFEPTFCSRMFCEFEVETLPGVIETIRQ